MLFCRRPQHRKVAYAAVCNLMRDTMNPSFTPDRCATEADRDDVLVCTLKQLAQGGILGHDGVRQRGWFAGMRPAVFP